MTQLTRKQINTIKQADYVCFRHRQDYGPIIEAVRENKNSMFNQHEYIPIDSKLPYGFTSAFESLTIRRGDTWLHGAFQYALKNLKTTDDVSLLWDRNGHRNQNLEEHGLITETLYLKVNNFLIDISTHAKKDNTANMLK